jgi:low temperature requirement protein LtrA
MVVFVDQPLFAVLSFLGLTVAMLAYSLHEKQWKDPAINRQNIFNEVILYMIAILFFFCRGNFAEEMHSMVGLVLLGLIGALAIVNMIVMTYAALRGCILCISRVFNKRILKRRKSHKKALQSDVSSLLWNHLVRVEESRTSFWSRIFGRKRRATEVEI